ncbi:DUF2971 domain-containing protein [Marinifilum fragile]|uniref:DUF2971 domain-containing protein n=1 Tax=Marinifilum fragile TaxID=570161 RepID=UPI002AAAED6D|nr:DUF2971 domain-containing protein [Marinifilum fragile]
MSYNSRITTKRKWQRSFIRKVFENSSEKKKSYSKTVLDNLKLLNEKNEYMPKNLFRFYSPTSANISDIQNRRIWLSHPSSFNDPFDCNIGYDSEEFEKKCLIDFINKMGCVKEKDKAKGFTNDEFNRIKRSQLGDFFYWTTKYENYSSAKWYILSKKNKDFKQLVDEELNSKLKEVDKKVESLKSTNIRISCFSQFKDHEEFNNQILMWSHYADDHKGFCVEYDLGFLKEETKLELDYLEFLNDTDSYLKERMIATIKASLFPVEYTSQRINIPITRLRKLRIDNKGLLVKDNGIEELVYKTFIVKSSRWNYEKEWRLIVDENISNYYGNKIPFPYAKKIYLGCKASTELIETMMEIGNNLDVEVYLQKMDGKKFTLDSFKPWEYKYRQETRKWKNPYDK